MKNNIPATIINLNSVIIANEAIKRGIKINHINYYQQEYAFLELSYKKHIEYMVGRKSSRTSSVADYAVKNKALTKNLLDRAKINVVEGKLFDKKNTKKIYDYINKIKYPIVIKKYDGSLGDLVFVGIEDDKSCSDILKKVLKKEDYILVEKEFKGEDFRIFASRKKFFAAVKRCPANIVGDGVHKIKELIDIKNKDHRRGDRISYSKTPLFKIEINKNILENLSKENLNLDTILLSGKKIYLRKNANITTGGDSIDVTDQIHLEFKKIAIKAVCAIPDLEYAGIDLMTNKDISKKPTKKSYAIIEMNSSPEVVMHHLPYQGKSRNVAKEIIDILFPETRK